MIRLATASDAGRILGYLRATPNPPTTSEEQIAQLLSEPGWVVMIDDVSGAVAGIVASNTRRSPTRRNAKLGVVDIPWLLPRAAWTINNVDDFPPVLLAALQECVVRYPASITWPCGGEFEGDQTDDISGRAAKSREIGQFWGARYGLTIDVKDNPFTAGLVRSEAPSVAHLIEKFTAYIEAHR